MFVIGLCHAYVGVTVPIDIEHWRDLHAFQYEYDVKLKKMNIEKSS